MKCGSLFFCLCYNKNPSCNAGAEESEGAKYTFCKALE